MKTDQAIQIVASMILTVVLLTSCSESIDGDKISTADLVKSFKDNNLKISLATKNAIRDSLLNAANPLPSNGIPTDRNDLGNMRTVVKIYNGSTNAGLTVPGFGGLKLGINETNLNVYYIETKIVKSATDTIVYGIGYSAHYLFKKVKKGVDISNLPSIAASVQIENTKTQVFYSLQSYGVKSINLVRYFKPTVNRNFDVDGFGIMQSSIDGIHNVLGDSLLSRSVKFTPEILKFVKPFELEQ